MKPTKMGKRKKVRPFFTPNSRLVFDYFLLIDYFTNRLLVDYRLVDGSLTYVALTQWQHCIPSYKIMYVHQLLTIHYDVRPRDLDVEFLTLKWHCKFCTHATCTPFEVSDSWCRDCKTKFLNHTDFISRLQYKHSY